MIFGAGERDFHRNPAHSAVEREPLRGIDCIDLKGFMAESEGFEPPIALRLCLISSQVHSTGLCQLSALD